MNKIFTKAIEIKNVNFSYNKNNTVFRDFSLDLYAQEVTAIMGNNGCGKSTLSKLIMGILKPLSGSIFILGENASSMTLGHRGQQIGYLFQNPTKQMFAATVYEELAFSLEMKGYDHNIINKRVSEILNLFEMEHLKDVSLHHLSGGEKHCLALGAMLIHQPKFVILDEPTASLDLNQREILSKIIHCLKNKNIGIMLISHNLSFVKQHAQRMIKIKGGRIYFDVRLDT